MAEKDMPGDYNVVVHLDSAEAHHRSVISTPGPGSIHLGMIHLSVQMTFSSFHDFMGISHCRGILNTLDLHLDLHPDSKAPSNFENECVCQWDKMLVGQDWLRA